ncbi:MurR/RpiR family transcriptional regulator [Nocardioides sp. TRM66260-LWL]|uniref:MurR/RpiR family transcriptional regulator n=1 Tax=Nocardioides sp. TRM66260-LWL TaxID=2874478 RepID=UPI001CC70762|nr:MurR/RpiR family transcriptional regulator [Nocardioides sp. TRM66260-LWL]MBZ5734660.1 MurR/RpiR family transcriptional regulator [Nocardioides sp. TRM66260-LWL]
MTASPAGVRAEGAGVPWSRLPIDERIAARRHALSPQERRAAATLVAHLDDLATYRAAELADLAGVSKATMSRLFRSLGFADFDEVREHLRGLRGGEPGRLRAGAGAVGPDLSAHLAAEAGNLRRALEQPGVAAAVRLLAEARTVTVAGWRNSHPVALHLRQQLAHVRPDVRLAPLPGQVSGEELVGLGEDDVVVAVGFRRRPAGFGAFVAEAAGTGAAVVLLADPSAQAHAAHADVQLVCELEGLLGFDSYAAAMGLVAVLADGVLAARDDGAARVAAITAAYRRLDEVE